MIVGEGFAGSEAAMRRIEREGNESGDDPGPGAQSVMRDVEPEGCAEGIFFIFGAEDALRNVTTAAGFCARVPTAPPLDTQKKNKRDERNSPESFAGEAVREIGEEGERIGDSLAGFGGFVTDDGKT